MASERDLMNRIQSDFARLTQAVVDATYWHRHCVQNLEVERQGSLAETENQYRQALAAARREYEEKLVELKDRGQALTQAAGLEAKDTLELDWPNWEPPDEGAIPRVTRLAAIRIDTPLPPIRRRNGKKGDENTEVDFFCPACEAFQTVANPKILKSLKSLGGAIRGFNAPCPACGQPLRRIDFASLPAFLPIIGGRNVLIKASGKAKEWAREAIQVLMLRLFWSLQPGKLRLVCIDPVGLGSTMAGFIKGLPDFLTGGMAFYESNHIEQQLADLEAHMAMVKQKYLGVRFSSIEDYNSYAGKVEEPYRLLVIADFPSRFTDSAAQRLVSIATNGPSTGVYVVAMVDEDQQKLPYGFNLADLERTATVISFQDRDCIVHDPHFEGHTVTPDPLPPDEEYEGFLKAVGDAAIAASEVKVPFEDFFPAQADWWQGDARAGVRVPIGQFGAREIQSFALDEEMLSSALIIGKTGSGKSTLLHVLVHSLALNYSPDELQLYLLDLKEVEFKDYAKYGLPHARVVAINCEREFGLSVLQGLDDQLHRRMARFRELNFQSLSEYRSKSGESIPRLLLIVDEFQELFSADDVIASSATSILDRLVRMGRAFGINLVLASQSLMGPYASSTLPGSTKNQIPIRVVLQCADADSRLALSDDNDAARLLERPGEAIYNSTSGFLRGNNRFQVFWLSGDERERYLRQVQELVHRRGYVPQEPQIVFEGDAPAEIDRNRLLRSVLSTSTWPGPARRVSAWLGEPIAIKPPTAAHVRRQSGSSLLIVGQNDETAMGVLVAALVSLAAQQKPLSLEDKALRTDSRFYVLDFGSVDAPYSDLLAHMSNVMPHSIQIGRRRHLPEMITVLAEELQRRIDEDDETAPSVYLIVFGLHRARDLRYDDTLDMLPLHMDDEPVPPTAAQRFATILREGPDLGMHTLVWCDTLNNLNRTLDRQALREFEMRVILQMNRNDSSNLIDSTAASTLGPYRAVFYSEDEGRLEKFRPYALPSKAWIEWVGEQLRRREELGE